uniref:Cyanovirin-N domain-containing protein n=1 Tax=Nonomuraea gerenzanensis TaxID=93944 RepID=A0A1M4E2X4_9ACTN|nr:hypothetical protein BN4615_P2722 [Nonomuraea gerenzanensis]
MIRLVPATAAAVLALMGLGSPPTYATTASSTLPPILQPTYTCDSVRGDPGRTVLFGNCTASLGAVTNGDFSGEAVGVARQTPLRIKCTGGGTADAPGEVALQDCTRID